MSTPSNAETRLNKAEPAGVVREGHAMTLVRLDDVKVIVAEKSYYRSEAFGLDEKIVTLTHERDDLKNEVVELRKGISTAVSTLEAAACAMR